MIGSRTALLASGLLLTALAIGASPALAQSTGNLCLKQATGLNNPSCSANDVRIGTIDLVGGAATCVEGELFTGDFKAIIESSPNRYAIGLWMNESGGAARDDPDGTCFRDYLDPNDGWTCDLTDTNAGAACTQGGTECGNQANCGSHTCDQNAGGPYWSAEPPSLDSCGDVFAQNTTPCGTCVEGTNAGNACLATGDCSDGGGDCVAQPECNGGTNDGLACSLASDCPSGTCESSVIGPCTTDSGGTCLFSERVFTFTLICNDTSNPEDAIADVGSCTSWDNQVKTSGNYCTDELGTNPGTGAKCNCDDAINIAGLVTLENAKIELIKDLGPTADTGKFTLTIATGVDGRISVLDPVQTPVVTDVGDGGTTGQVQVAAGTEADQDSGITTYTVSEVAGTGTDLADYVSTITCVDRGLSTYGGTCSVGGADCDPNGTAATDDCVAAGNTCNANASDLTSGPGIELGALSLPNVVPGQDIVCTVTNEFKPDRGDAPDTYGEATHYFRSGLYIGGAPDVDIASWSDGNDVTGIAGDDDAEGTGPDDEDGTTFAAVGADDGDGVVQLDMGETAFYNLGVSVTNTTGVDATLTGWIDWNCDGDFEDSGEMAGPVTIEGTGVPSCHTEDPDPPTPDDPPYYCALSWGTVDGTTPLMSATSAGNCAVTDTTFARLRLTTDSSPGPTGAATDGEVEDYPIGIAAATTPAIIADFNATGHIDGGAVVAWTTASELGAVAFRVERLVGVPGEKGSHWKRVHKAAWLPAVLQLQGGLYRVYDDAVDEGELHRYRVIEKSRKGRELTYGPFDVLVAAGTGELEIEKGHSVQERFDAERVAENVATRAKARGKLKARALSQARTAPSGGGGSGDTLRILVANTGIHGLSVQELVDAFGSDTDQVESMLRRGKLRLSSRGQDVPWYEQDGMFYFYGQGSDNQFSTTRTYWLYMKQNGALMTQLDVPAAAPVEQVFIDTRDHELDALWWLSLTNDPGDDIWFWTILSPFNTSLPVALPVPGSQAVAGELKLRLWGASNADHVLQVKTAAGENVGEVSFSGDLPYETPVPLTVPAGALGGETLDLVVTLQPNATDYSAVLIDGFEVTWQRPYAADGGALKYPAAGATSVSDFSSEQVVTMDVFNPDAPVWLTGGEVTPDGSDYLFSAQLPAETSEYASTDAASVLKPAAMELDVKSNLVSANNRADYVVISNAELMDAAAALSDYRSAGLKTMVVDIQDIYDEFTAGEPWPSAMNEFAKASRSWRTAPSYMVILGDGSFDYRDITPTGYNFVSPQMFGSSDGLFASDTLQGDVTGDGVPEVAFGRIPVKSVAEGLAYVAKLEAYEAGIGELPSLLLTDLGDKGGDFSYSQYQVETELDGDTININLRDTIDVNEARDNLDEELDQGVRMINYLGHAGVDRVSALGLIVLNDVAEMDNPVTPSFVGLSCLINNYSIPGFDGLGERLVVKPVNGMMASWAASGESYNDQATAVGVEFHRIAGDYQRLGDAIIATFQARPYLVPVYTLLGDPALLLQ